MDHLGIDPGDPNGLLKRNCMKRSSDEKYVQKEKTIPGTQEGSIESLPSIKAHRLP